MGMDDYVVETHALTKRYGSLLAVDSLSIEVPHGGVFGLLGPNGSGKTTIMSMLLGLIAPTSGTFRLLGHNTGKGHWEALRHVGAMVESPALYPYHSTESQRHCGDRGVAEFVVQGRIQEPQEGRVENRRQPGDGVRAGWLRLARTCFFKAK
jgi:ABC-type Fe3+/spermidine/putrescine transport system ATPase subunit